MTATTVRANARATSKTPPPKPETGEEFVLSTIAAEKKRQSEARADDAEAADTLSDEQPTLLDLSNELSLIRDLVEASYMAAGSLPPGIGRDPLSRLLNLTSDRLQDAIDDLEKIREAHA